MALHVGQTLKLRFRPCFVGSADAGQVLSSAQVVGSTVFIWHTEGLGTGRVGCIAKRALASDCRVEQVHDGIVFVSLIS